MAKTVSIISLGCPRNLADSEKLIYEFTKNGYRFQRDILNSDTVIINTCAFIEDAKRESIDAILKVIDAKKDGDVKNIIVAGCLPERYQKELAGGLKEVDEFRGVLDFKDSRKQKIRLTPRHYAYIKISEGCANRCSYCIIPYLKGKYKSRHIESVRQEAENLIKDGAKEIILIGQDTSLYGIDLYKKKRLADLLKELSAIKDDIWIRLLYLHPDNLGRDVIRVIKENENICRYIDLPLEHINDRILKKMGRRSNKKEIASLINYIREEIPGINMRTSFIAGFPGETEKAFKELLSFIREMKFDRLGVFKYSREEGTPACGYKNQIPEKQKESRYRQLMSTQQDVSRGINEGLIGRTLKVLIEEKKKDIYIGRTEYDAPEIDGLVYVKGKKLKTGAFCNVKIEDAYEYDLVGKYEPGK